MKILWRVVFVLILLTGLFLFPWWVTIPAAFLGIFFFPHFWEGVLTLAAFDVLYGVPIDMLYDLRLPFFFLSVLLLLAAEYLRPRVR